LRAGEIDEAVAVIDLNVEQNQHAKTECAGNFRTETIADVVHVESNEILAVVLEMSKLPRLARAWKSWLRSTPAPGAN
jgi:hypothetical protein